MGDITWFNYLYLSFSELQNNAICPADIQSKENNHKWCTFQVFDPDTNIVEYLYLTSLFIISIILARFIGLLYRYRNNKRYKKYFGKMYFWAYIIVSAWLLTSLVKVGLSLLVYRLFMISDFDNDEIPKTDDPDINSSIVILANSYNILNSFSAFLINLVMTLIPFQWLKIALQIISKSEIATQQVQVTIQKWIKLLKIIKIYLKYIRNIFPFLLFLQPLLFALTSFARCKYHILNMYFIFYEASLILIFYLFAGYVTYFLRKNYLIKLQQKQALQNKVQFCLLFVVLIVRMVRNLLSITQILHISYDPNGNCSNRNYKNNQFLLVVFCFHNFFMHLLPVLIILYIYQPNIKKLKKYEQLYDLQEDSCIEGSYNFKAIARGFYGSSLTSQADSRIREREKVTIQYSS